jgi:hypothetical protein
MGMNRPVTMTDVLGVMREFEPYEPAGIGIGLIAWELHQPETAITPHVERASAAGWIEAAGRDPRSGEELWRLTLQGRARIRVA